MPCKTTNFSSLLSRTFSTGKSNKNLDQISVGFPFFYSSADTGNEDLTNVKSAYIYDEYDKLCKNYPEWIKREEDIGLDCDGNAIRHYTLKNQQAVVNKNERGPDPNNWTFENDCKHVLINAGFHGNEKSSVMGVLLLMKEIASNSDDFAKYIRANVVLDIVPIACPWNFDNNSRKNKQGVDCCFDFVNYASSEAQALRRLLMKIKNRCVAVIDSHNNPSDKCRTCFFEQRPTDKHFLLQNRLCSQLSAYLNDDWKKYYPDLKGPYLHMVAGEWKVSYTSFSWFFAKKGFYGLTIETPCDTRGGSLCNSKVCKFTKDILGNLIISFSQL